VLARRPKWMMMAVYKSGQCRNTSSEIMEILNDPAQERWNDEVTLNDLTLLEKSELRI
jgi:hypothetical protein